MKQMLSAPAFPALPAPMPVLANQAAVTQERQINLETTPQGVALAPLHGERFSRFRQAMVKPTAGNCPLPPVKSARLSAETGFTGPYLDEAFEFWGGND